MKFGKKRVWCVVAVIVLAGIFFLLFRKKEIENYAYKYEGFHFTEIQKGSTKYPSYAAYLKQYKDQVGMENAEIEIDLEKYKGDKGVYLVDNYEGCQRALYTESKSEVNFEIQVPSQGLYWLYVDYLLPESRGVVAQREIRINDAVPFDEVQNVSFNRMWGDGGPKRVDSRGNEYRPSQKEITDWQNTYVKDHMGYYSEPFAFYMDSGKNKITIQGIDEPVVYRQIKFIRTEEVDYETYQKTVEGQDATQEGRNYSQVIEGENAVRRSEPSLFPQNDRSSPYTSPSSVTKKLLNYIGGDTWRLPGEWIEWEFEVPENGYYNITIKGKQNYTRGSVSARSVYIDGKIPFKELENISFEFDNEWQYITLSKDADPYKFYLEKGKHTIRLEGTLGELGVILKEVDNSTYQLNEIYRKILVYTGPTPDKYREYNIDIVYPEILGEMDMEAKRLYKMIDDMVACSGQKSSNIARAQTLAAQLERFVKKPELISLEFTSFKDNITALGTASLSMRDVSLAIDAIEITGTDRNPNVTKPSFLGNAWHEIKSLAASLVVDYNTVGDTYGKGEAVTVWVTTGRDQANILRAMIDEGFTSKTGVKVNLELVDPSVLLRAVVADRGPNVVLGVGSTLPVDYALRNSLEDLRQFSDIDQVLGSYSQSSYRQYSLNDSLYAIPETQGFSVLFYRKDILSELELDIPQTWKDLVNMLPTIQGKNMDIGVSGIFNTLLYQKGGDLYSEDGMTTTIDAENGIRAFQEYTKYFNDYGCPVEYDFVSRFRSGEMPVAVAGYGTFNTLMVSAPEIRGLWDFTLIPGTERTDETGKLYIDRSEPISGAATILIKTKSEGLKAKSWEFMKWWAQSDTQVHFGREIEALLGASARYGTANMEAFRQMAWDVDALDTIMEQWEWTVGIREVPGSYYTDRHINNAYRRVINDKDDPRVTIIHYANTINDELEKKRVEFGLPTRGEE